MRIFAIAGTSERMALTLEGMVIGWPQGPRHANTGARERQWREFTAEIAEVAENPQREQRSELWKRAETAWSFLIPFSLRNLPLLPFVFFSALSAVSAVISLPQWRRRG
jgi:hypothetical protein